MTEDEYGGHPLNELRINSLEWPVQARHHIRSRSTRYPERTEFDVEPEWATEAALDPARIVSQTGGLSIQIIGHSRSAPGRSPRESGRLLKVWAIPGDPAEGHWVGVSSCAANRAERNRYMEMNR